MNLLTRIKNYNSDRLPDLLPLKYKAMSLSPFTFLRGSCAIFYEDLLKDYPFEDSPLTWICGDMHLENFGSYKGANKIVYFDVNDFDEAVKAPTLYEITRLIVSIQLASEEIGFTKNEVSAFVKKTLQSYIATLIKSKARNIEKETATGLVKKLIETVSMRSEKQLISKRTIKASNYTHLLETDRLLKIPSSEKKMFEKKFIPWFNKTFAKNYLLLDVGFRIAGTGSIGVKRYCCLIQNKKNITQKKLIDVKQAMPSCLTKFIKIKQPNWDNDAQRVTTVQEIMQHVEPSLVGTFEYNTTWYEVKELQPTADKININEAKNKPVLIEKFCEDIGILAASAQLRSSGRLGAANADDLKLFAEKKDWIPTLLEWCDNYTKQVKKDYSAFNKAYKQGFFN